MRSVLSPLVGVFVLGVAAVIVGAFMASTPLGIATAGALAAWIALQLERSRS